MPQAEASDTTGSVVRGVRNVEPFDSAGPTAEDMEKYPGSLSESATVLREGRAEGAKVSILRQVEIFGFGHRFVDDGQSSVAVDVSVENVESESTIQKSFG